jgi:myo-inositol-1(or 4)-monophosphatase
MIKAVRKAARSLIRDFGELEYLQTSKKGLNDFVSLAYKRAEKILITELQNARHYGFLLKDGEIRGEDNSHRFIIDSLNGSTNFSHAIPFFCISLALEQINSTGKKEVIAAVIEAPILGETFWAEKGSGAWIEKYNDNQMEANRMRVSGRKDIADSLMALGDSTEQYTCKQMIISNFSKVKIPVRVIGSSALSLAYVAAGRLDGFIQTDENLCDVAAGLMMVKEAGGFVSPHRAYKASASLPSLASNSEMHNSLLTIINQKNLNDNEIRAL